jgi:probable HAF family extracellular repeat protein
VPGASSTAAHLLNNAGQVVGTYQDAAGISHSFLYQDGRYQDITVPGAAFTSVLQSSSSGRLLGTYFDRSGLHPFIDDNGKGTIISVPGASSTDIASGYSSFAIGPAINDLDQVIGTYIDSTGSHSFLYSNGSYITLAVPGAQTMALIQINNAGEVLGSYTDSSGTHSFVYANGVYTRIAFPGATSTDAIEINDVGQVAGNYRDGTGSHAFLDTNGTYTTIAAPPGSGQQASTSFSRLDNAGEVLGTYSGPTGSGPFLYSDGTSRALGVPGVQATGVNSMNDLGDLIGSCFDGAQTHSFLARPMPAAPAFGTSLTEPHSALPHGPAIAGTVDANASLALHPTFADTGNPASS